MRVRDLKFEYTSAVNKTDAMHSIRGRAIHGEGRRLYDDSGANIDVLVVWTRQAECRINKLAWPCIPTPYTESIVRGRVDLAITETNNAFVMSGVSTSLRLVHAYRDPVYIEPTSNVFNTVLVNLQSKIDGKLDSVHAKRTLYGADTVSMIIGT